MAGAGIRTQLFKEILEPRNSKFRRNFLRMSVCACVFVGVSLCVCVCGSVFDCINARPYEDLRVCVSVCDCMRGSVCVHVGSLFQI